MPRGKGILGHALYFEFRKSENTQMRFFTQGVFDAASGSLVEPQMIARVISPAAPKRKWRYKPIEGTELDVDRTKKQLLEVEDVLRAKAAVNPLLQAISKEVQVANDHGWQNIGRPLVIEMTANDVESIRLMRTPEALIRRLMNARLDSGYPEAIFNDQTGA